MLTLSLSLQFKAAQLLRLAEKSGSKTLGNTWYVLFLPIKDHDFVWGDLEEELVTHWVCVDGIFSIRLNILRAKTDSFAVVTRRHIPVYATPSATVFLPNGLHYGFPQPPPFLCVGAKVSGLATDTAEL